MSFDTVGANITQLGTLRQLFDQKAAEVDDLIRQISSAVGEAGGRGAVHWEGQVAERFRQDWTSTFVPNLRRLGEALHESAGYVERNRQSIDQVLNGATG
jgi:uncharacterized protein YukE